MSAAQTPTLTTLVNFTTTNGAYPFGGLVYSGGALYGTTFGGGKYGYGNVFTMTPSSGTTGWNTAILYNFQDATIDGANPYGSLLVAASGVIYGTTTRGGAFDMGTVFALQPPLVKGGDWTETVLYSFGSSPEDAAFPYGGVVADASGVLYGTTVGGGETGSGTVYALTPDDDVFTESVLYSFGSPNDAANPYAGLAIDGNGVLYGTSPYGGSSGSGTVFSLAPQPGGVWTESVLCAFPGGTGGANPYAGILIGVSGGLYGVTTNGGTQGGGTVFNCSQAKSGAWGATVLYNPLASAASYGTLISDTAGDLYGTTGGAHGAASNNGTIFRIAPPANQGGAWTFTTLYAYTGAQGGGPRAGVVWGPPGQLFGTTVGLGTTHEGTVFRLSF